MKINMETKFDIGQEVYIIRENTYHINNESKCSICEGIGKIVYRGQELRCPECSGKGTLLHGVDTVSKFSIDGQGAITGIKVQYANEICPYIKYKINKKFLSEDRLFATQEEAEARCRKLNGEVANG